LFRIKNIAIGPHNRKHIIFIGKNIVKFISIVSGPESPKNLHPIVFFQNATWLKLPKSIKKPPFGGFLICYILSAC
jgi:hypothetical protein